MNLLMLYFHFFNYFIRNNVYVNVTVMAYAFSLYLNHSDKDEEFNILELDLCSHDTN